MFKALVDKVISIGHITQEIKAGELYVESVFTKAFPSFFEKVEGAAETFKTKVEEAVEKAKEVITEKVEAVEEKGEEILKDESSEVKAVEEKVEEVVEETKGRKGRK